MQPKSQSLFELHIKTRGFYLLFNVIVVGYGVIAVAIVPIITLCYSIPLTHCTAILYTCEAVTKIERMIAYHGDTIRNHNAYDTGAIIERRKSYRGDIIRNHYAREAYAMIERTITYLG